MHTHSRPAVTSFPFALSYPSLTGKDQHHPFLPHPFFSFFFLSSPRHHLRLHFYAYVLFIHSSQIRSREMRDICCVYFEDASRCSITWGCQGLVCIQWHGECIANRWWERTCMAGRLINKIYYGNATEERQRCDYC